MESPNVEIKLLPSENMSNNVKPKDTFPVGSEELLNPNTFGKNCPSANGDSDFDDNESRQNISNRIRSNETSHALSGLYAQIMVVIAAILVFTELLHGPIPLLFFHGYLFTYLVGGSIICFIGVYVSLLADKCPRLMNRKYDGDVEKLTTSTPFMRNLLDSDVSIYLRCGAVVFGLGTLISSGLEVASIVTMQTQCMDELNLAQPVLRVLFSFLQLHFIFMNAKEIVHAFGWFRHVALMHLVATNIAIWIRLVMWESARDWLDGTHFKRNISIEWPVKNFSVTLHFLESDVKSPEVYKHKPHHFVRYAPNCYWPDDKSITEAEDLIELHMCLQNSTIGTIWEKAMPYLYPFNIQYSLVAAGIIYIIWSSLQSSRMKLQHVTTLSVYETNPSKNDMNCGGSTRGLFLGLIELVAGIIVLILYFVVTEAETYNSLFLITILRCSIFGVSLLASIIGIFQIRKMKSKSKRQRRLSDLLQRTGMLAVYVYGICSMIVGGVRVFTKIQHLLLFMDGMMMVLQACFQSLFIYQVSKKRLGPSNLNEKPGRDVIIFLVFSNLVLWLLESFTTQHENSDSIQKQFYGAIAWAVISRIFLPLVVFYRFHSIAALMEAWNKSYKIKKN